MYASQQATVWHFSCSITWPIKSAVFTTLRFSNNIRLNLTINRSFTVAYNNPYIHAAHSIFQPFRIGTPRLNYLAGQNQVNIATSDPFTYPFCRCWFNFGRDKKHFISASKVNITKNLEIQYLQVLAKRVILEALTVNDWQRLTSHRIFSVPVFSGFFSTVIRQQANRNIHSTTILFQRTTNMWRWSKTNQASVGHFAWYKWPTYKISKTSTSKKEQTEPI